MKDFIFSPIIIFIIISGGIIAYLFTIFPSRTYPLNNPIPQSILENCKTQHEISSEFQPLLNYKTGELLIKGGYTWNVSKIEYNRNAIQYNSLRIKEWDYYLIRNNEYAVAVTIANIGYIGVLSVHFVNFQKRQFNNHGIVIPFPSYQLPRTPVEPNNLCVHRTEKGYACFNLTLMDNNIIKRELEFYFKEFDNEKGIKGHFELMNEYKQKDSITVVIPFDESPDYFYFNYKLNYANKVNGNIKIGNDKIEFHSENSEALLDWGRGIWPYKSIWYWSSATGKTREGNRIGFNLGYGFGNYCISTENVFFYKNEAYKLGHVRILIPKENNYETEKEWILESIESNELVEFLQLKFKPIVNRNDVTNLGIILQNANQVFGKFNGKCKLRNGEVILIENLIGFVEEVENKW